MPSYGLTSSVPPVSSPLSPCISTLLSRPSCSEPSSSTACAPSFPVPPSHPSDLSHSLFDNTSPFFPQRPPSQPQPDGAPPFPSPGYQVVFPLLPSTRFPPPPPTSSLPVRPACNLSFFDTPLGQHQGSPGSYYPSQPCAYDSWADRNCASSGSGGGGVGGGDGVSKRLSQWGVPTPKSAGDANSFLSSSLPYPPPPNYISNFGTALSPKFPDAAVLPPNTAASFASPLLPADFAAFHPPNVPMDFPHSASSRLPLHPDAPGFLPGLDPAPSYPPGPADFLPPEQFAFYPPPRPGLPTGPLSASDHFHDASPRPVDSPETAPAFLMDPNSPSRFLGSSFRGSSSASRSPLTDSLSPAFSSYNPVRPLAPRLGSSAADFPGPSSSPPLLYPSFLSGPVFCPYPSPSILYQDSGRYDGVSFGAGREEDRAERIVSANGQLIYQHLSPEELRWKHYEPLYADDFERFARVYPHDLEHHDDSAVKGITITSPIGGSTTRGDGKRSSAGFKGRIEQANGYETAAASAAQNHPGPSLKLAASALAEMLALGSGEGTSTLKSGLPSDSSFPGGEGGEPGSERIEDFCSSSKSACKEGKRASFREQFGEFTAESFCPDVTSSCALSGAAGDIGGQLQEETLIDHAGATPVCTLSTASPGQSQSGRGRQVPIANGSAAELHGIHDAESSSTTATTTAGIVDHISQGPRPWRLESLPTPQAAGSASFPEGSVSGAATFASKVTVPSGLSVFGPTHQVSSSTELCSPPLDASHDDQWHFKSTSCGSSLPLSQPYLDSQGSISLQTTEAASSILASLKWGCLDASQPEAERPGSGLHSLTASISNLSKVLFALDSKALTRPDCAALGDALQSSILRLSECLLLEQSRVSRSSSSRFVGSDEPSARRQENPDVSLVDFDLRHPIEQPGRRPSLGRLKGSEAGVLAGPGRSSVNAARLRGVSRSRPTAAGSAEQETGQRNVTECPFAPSGSHLHSAVNTALGIWNEKSVLDRSSIEERLRVAEAREAKLKKMVEDLREELELERAENKGTAYLCDKILQEGDARRAAPRSGEQVGLSKVTRDRLVYDLKQGTRSAPEDVSDGERSRNSTKAVGPTGQSACKRRNATEDGTCTQSDEESGSSLLANTSQESLLNSIDQMKVHLGVIQARLAAGSNLNLSDDAACRSDPGQGRKVAPVREGIFEQNPVVNHGGRESILRRPDNTSSLANVEYGSIEARLALLHARPEPTLPCEPSGILEPIPGIIGPPFSTETSSRNSSKPAAGGKATIGKDNGKNDVDPLKPGGQAILPRLSVLRVQSEPNGDNRRLHDTGVSQNSTGVTSSDSRNGQLNNNIEARLALLQARDGWDNELGVFTETEPCTPGRASTLGNDRVSQNGNAILGTHEEQATFAAKASDSTSRQPEAVFNFYNSWDHFPDRYSNDPEVLRGRDWEQETEVESPIPSTQPFTDGQNDVEARILTIRSRPDWAAGEESGSDDEDHLGRRVCKASASSTHSGRCDADRLETLREISLVRLLDSDVGVSDSSAGKDNKVLADGGPDEGPGTASPGESPLTSRGSQTEEDSSWEHVCFP